MKTKSLKSKNKNIKKTLRTTNLDDNKLHSDQEYELDDLKKSAKIDQAVDHSYLDKATKLKEEEVAKTTLINDTTEIEDLFDLDNKTKQKK